MANALKQITAKAKKLYKKGKAGISWKSAIKKAGAAYRGKKTTRKRARVSGVKRSRKKKVYRRGQVVRVKHVLAGIGSVSHHKSQYRKSLENEIARKAGRREIAIKKNQRKKITREIAKLRSQYRAVC